MREPFIASNGTAIMDSADGTTLSRHGRNMLTKFDFLNYQDMHALREFFQHERDEELGRWRWPEDTRYVVYALDSDQLRVMYEPSGVSVTVRLSNLSDAAHGKSFVGAARAYRAAHQPPKPWHDAKPGEVWAITHAVGGETAWTVKEDFHSGERLFSPVVVTDPSFVGISVTGTQIASARRIWPEVVDGE